MDLSALKFYRNLFCTALNDYFKIVILLSFCFLCGKNVLNITRVFHLSLQNLSRITRFSVNFYYAFYSSLSHPPKRRMLALYEQGRMDNS